LRNSKISPHDKKVNYIKRFWENYGAWVSVKEECSNAESLYFKNEFVVDLTQASSMDLAEQLDCYYIWIEVVDTNPPDSKKMEWLPKMLSKRWLILVYDYGESFTPKRPDTYEGKMTEDETKKVLHKLIQQLFRLKQGIKANN
jgi:hypothetical protein